MNACANMVIQNPTAPKAGADSCLPDGVTYAGFRAMCGAPGSCENVTLANNCDYGNCNFFACDTQSPTFSSCSDEIDGVVCSGSGCPNA